jgi:hypothetical protein
LIREINNGVIIIITGFYLENLTKEAVARDGFEPSIYGL